MSLRLPLVALVAAFSFATAVPAWAGTIVEYYNRTLDHYFVTGYAHEITALDRGDFQGWQRTGYSFQTFEATDTRAAGSSPVCRFYGNPARGLDSHFYEGYPSECQQVKIRWPDDWRIESDDVMRVHPVSSATGQCPAGTKPVYRLYNRRADVNHRYTTESAVVDAMLAKGYVLEGAGNPQRPVAFCAADVAPAQPAAGAPVCTIASGTPFPTVGTPVTLTATCTNTPTTYAWVNCTGTGNTCVATATAVGAQNYALIPSNALGAGAQASLSLNWQLSATGAPVCTVTSSAAQVALGSVLRLTANCSQAPTQFQWMACSPLLLDICNVLTECPAASAACQPIGTQQATVYYALIARNAAGASAKAGTQVEWTTSGGATAPPPSTSPTPTCNLSPSSSTPAVGSTLTLTALCTNSPTGYTWTGCSSSSSVCTISEANAGLRSYTVTARNASGVGSPAQADVNWQQPPTAPPVCSVSASTSAPYVGGNVVLTASCTQSPTGFQWTNCSSTTSTCTATNTQTGPVTYSVTGTNPFGPGSAASTTLTWGTPPAGGTDFCANYANVNMVNLTWGGYLDSHANGGFARDGVLVGRLRVPATASGSGGLVSVVEYIDGQARRIMSISPQACDFRGFTPGVGFTVDSTGTNNPMGWGSGINPNIFFNITGSSGGGIKLDPGRTYYINIRNIDFDTGQISCTTGSCNVRTTVNTPR